MKKYILGIDIGGTAIKIGVINDNGSIHSKWEIPTNIGNKGETIATDAWSSIVEQLKALHIEKDSIQGIGIGAPGFIDEKTGFVYKAVNIGWEDFDLANQFNELSGLPVFVANDANVAALGENWVGAGNQADNLIAVTLGTGVGGGIIANGAMISGENGTAGEIGHITIDPDGYPCNCGRKGCLETITSATGMVRQAIDLIEKNPESDLAEYYQKHGEITTKDIFNLAKQGDPFSEQIIDHTADVLGFAISNIATVINPSKILVGGGVSLAGETFINKIENCFRKYALPRVSDICEFKIAELGNDAGMIGAAYLVKERLQSI